MSFAEDLDPLQKKILANTLKQPNAPIDFSRFALPLIKKSHPRLIAEDLVKVQPMSQPSSLLFYMKYKYALQKPQGVVALLERISPCGMFGYPCEEVHNPEYDPQHAVFRYDGDLYWVNLNKTRIWEALDHIMVLPKEEMRFERVKQVSVERRRALYIAFAEML